MDDKRENLDVYRLFPFFLNISGMLPLRLNSVLYYTESNNDLVVKAVCWAKHLCSLTSTEKWTQMESPVMQTARSQSYNNK